MDNSFKPTIVKETKSNFENEEKKERKEKMTEK